MRCSRCRQQEAALNRKQCAECLTRNDRHQQTCRRDGTWDHTKECRARMKKSVTKLRDQVLEAYGGKPPRCFCCGEDVRDFLTIDHIRNDGAKERREIGKSAAFERYLRDNDFPPGYQILCSNCNSGRARNKENRCPGGKGHRLNDIVDIQTFDPITNKELAVDKMVLSDAGKVMFSAHNMPYINKMRKAALRKMV